MGLLEQIYEKAKENPQRIAFPEAVNEKMMQAAYETGKEGYIIPVLVGYADEIREALSSKGYEEDIFTIVDIREETYKKKLIDRYVALPQTLLKEKALNRRMQNPLYYAMVMEAVGEA
ncbi:MAG: phosphate acyltransferase, partial [Enterocloster aldenensis]